MLFIQQYFRVLLILAVVALIAIIYYLAASHTAGIKHRETDLLFYFPYPLK